MKTYSTNKYKYLKNDALIGGSRSNNINKTQKTPAKTASKKSTGCRGCSRRRKS